MNRFKNIKYFTFLLAILVLSVACEDERERLVLSFDAEDHIAPAFLSPQTASPVVITEENAGEEFETFEWERASFGTPVSVDYILQVSKTEDFEEPSRLVLTGQNSAKVSKGALNAAILAQGLPAFEESTVYMRVLARINGFPRVEPVVSSAITRTATTFQSSECGNFCTIGIIGSASPGGWNTDTDMRLADPTGVDKFTWTVTVYLLQDEVKFRANDDWADNWGASAFPSGTATQDGPNIPVPEAGWYRVVFNDESGDYNFTKVNVPAYNRIGIIGDATPGGWDNDTALEQDATNPNLWIGTITLTGGDAKFRANNSWDVNWGADSYPSGYGIGNGPNIPVPAGTFAVRFNSATAEYAFMPVNRATPYNRIGIIGDATPGGWGDDTALIRNPANPYKWSGFFNLTDGEAKFRADNNWDVNWGGSTFPTGIGTDGGPNIPVVEGRFFVTFDSGTGEYRFLR
ncbi:MAG: SusF/SusE family outer membrane protein [Cyclobacteriaceae bacterium]|nr:SusF/SusE family outer membrane protein [Cyclobacteriaceae bacterium]